METVHAPLTLKLKVVLGSAPKEEFSK
jgi:hypothetical protein